MLSKRIREPEVRLSSEVRKRDVKKVLEGLMRLERKEGMLS